MTAEGDELRPVNDLVRASLDAASSVDRKVARALLSDYPIAGLETVAELAERAAVSPASVTRFVSRLGFGGYPEFQKRLMREVHERMGSPLEQYGRTGLAVGDGYLAHAAGSFSTAVAASLAELPRGEFDRTVTLLTDPRRRVRLVGGRFSRVLADYLGAHLHLLRAGTQVLSGDEFARQTAVHDAGRDDVFVVFDFRRYDAQTVHLAREAASRGAEVALFTDRWLSPAADVAATVLPAHVEAPSPFDSLVPALAVVETVVAGVTDRLGAAGRVRLEQLEAMHPHRPAV
ncbi:MurR/RpiR family transcriptional regulator [Microbacterium sp.]|uniref:MurR/RpiR family transcriptional regulator n=1 Tax=Microbacterium sp. TaxID=51671 RepID=UPI003A8A3913